MTQEELFDPPDARRRIRILDNKPPSRAAHRLTQVGIGQ
jgi:hypothetical protein